MDDNALWQPGAHAMFFPTSFLRLCCYLEGEATGPASPTCFPAGSPWGRNSQGKSGLMLPLASNSATAICTQRLVDCCCKAGAAVWVQWWSWLQQEQHSTVRRAAVLRDATRSCWTTFVRVMLPAPVPSHFGLANSSSFFGTGTETPACWGWEKCCSSLLLFAALV